MVVMVVAAPGVEGCKRCKLGASLRILEAYLEFAGGCSWGSLWLENDGTSTQAQSKITDFLNMLHGKSASLQVQNQHLQHNEHKRNVFSRFSAFSTQFSPDGCLRHEPVANGICPSSSITHKTHQELFEAIGLVRVKLRSYNRNLPLPILRLVSTKVGCSVARLVAVVVAVAGGVEGSRKPSISII